jgi:hypothetical protein
LIARRLAIGTCLCASAVAAAPAPREALLQQPPPQDARQEPSSRGDDFELLPPEKPPDAAAVARQAELTRALERRRQLLRLHQLGGFATLATMTATVIVGQLNYNDKYGGGGDTGRYHLTHQALAYTTAGVFTATGLLALFAPSPFEKPLRFDTATLHKTAMLVATTGLVAQVVLGILTARHEGSVSQRDFALAHQIVGYTTLAATAAGFGVLFFP